MALPKVRMMTKAEAAAAPRGPLDETVRRMIAKGKLYQRHEFVREYFGERGWDHEHPTVEQIMEVRAQPGWA